MADGVDFTHWMKALTVNEATCRLMLSLLLVHELALFELGFLFLLLRINRATTREKIIYRDCKNNGVRLGTSQRQKIFKWFVSVCHHR